MKKAILTFSMIAMFLAGSINLATAQQSQSGTDTVNIDTQAKPTFYYATEEEKSASDAKSGGSGTIIAIIAGVAVVGAAGYFLLKKKK